MGLEKRQEYKQTMQTKMFKAKGETQVFFVFESKEPVDGWMAGTVNNPETNEQLTRYYDTYSRITGYVNGLEWRKFKPEGGKTTFKSIELAIADNDGLDIILRMPYNSKEYKAFAQSARNINFDLPVTFSTWKGKDDKGKEEKAFAIKQGDTFVPYYYKRGHNGLPDGKFNDITEVWDYSEKDAFLLEDLLGYAKPAIESAAFNRGIAPAKAYDPDAMPGEGEDEPATQPVSARATELLEAIWAEMKGDEEQWRDWYAENHVAEQGEAWLEKQLAFFVQRNAAPKAPSRPPVPSPTAPRTNKTSLPNELNANDISF